MALSGVVRVSLRRYFSIMARPEIGGRVTTRLPPELLARVDTAADERGVRRAEWLRQAARKAVTVQAPRYTEGRLRSATELARLIARHSEWAWAEDDALVDDLGGLLAYTIEDAAEAMQDLGWLAPGGAGAIWSRMPAAHVQGARAEELRSRLDAAGRHPHVNGSPYDA